MRTGDSYIGRAACGCVRAAHVISPARTREAARFCKQVVEDGLALERMDTASVRESRWACERCEPKAFARQESLALPSLPASASS